MGFLRLPKTSLSLDFDIKFDMCHRGAIVPYLKRGH